MPRAIAADDRSEGSRVARAVTSSVDFDLVPFRWTGAAMMALALALSHVPGNPGVPCPLKTITGVPCPLCGMTTSVKAVMGGHLHAALVANPFGLLAVAAAALLLLRPQARRLRLPSALLVAGVVASWGFQLHRFHFL